jgi:hypothetical protein
VSHGGIQNFPVDSNKTILSLFDRTGNWSLPYEEVGYTVMRVDQQNGWDVYQLTKDVIQSINPHGLLIALPCTDFAVSGSSHFWAKDLDGRTADSVRLALHCLDIVSWCPTLQWWALENPVGRLNTLIPKFAEFGPWYFHPYEFGGWLNPPGDAYPKKTGLWGKFNHNLEKREVMPQYHLNRNGKRIWTSSEVFSKGGKSLETKNARSVTPMGFARAFFAANP